MKRYFPSDSYRFDVTDHERLEQWLECCCGGEDAIGWSSDVDHLVFYSRQPTDVEGFVRLPCRMPARLMASLVAVWIADAKFPPEPDQDGSNVKGFRLYNEQWGFVDGCHEAFLAVAPAWCMFGK